MNVDDTNTRSINESKLLQVYKESWFAYTIQYIMEVLVIALSIGALGNFMNKRNSSPREITMPDGRVSAHDMPSSQLIYHDSRVREVEAYGVGKAAKKYPAHVSQQFPNDYMKAQEVVASTYGESSGYPAQVAAWEGSAMDDSLSAQFEKQRRAMLSVKDSVVTPVNPQTGALQAQLSADVYGGPAFRTTQFKQLPSDLLEPFSADFSQSGAPMSQLSGLPADPRHGNMQPHFKGSNRRNVRDDIASATLESMTGFDSGAGTITQKTEQAAVWNPPQNIKRVQMSDLTDLNARATYAMQSTNANSYKTPVPSFRDSPMDMKDVRVMPRNIDELNPNNAKQVITNRMTAPKIAQSRAMIPQQVLNFERPAPDNMVPVGNRSGITGSLSVPQPSVRDNRATTSTYDNTWTGVPSSQYKQNNNDSQQAAWDASMDDFVSKKNDVFTPRLGNPIDSSARMPSTTGVFIQRTVDGKGLANTYIRAGGDNKGERIRDNVHAPDATLGEMLDISNLTGKFNRVDRTDGAYTHIEMDAPMTSKEMNIENKYIGAPQLKNLGNGIRQHGIIDYTTIKETLHQSYMGNPTSDKKAGPCKDAHFEQYTDRTEEVKYLGPAVSHEPSEPWKETEMMSGLDFKPLIEDYVSAPNRVHDNKNRDAKQFTDSIQDSLTHKLDFGGHFGNIHDRAMPTSRDAIVDLKEDTCADGRINIGRVNEAVIDGKMKIEFELKDECKVIPVMGNAHVPTNDISHPGIEVRTINTEALNPRLSGDLKITNDLYPWV